LWFQSWLKCPGGHLKFADYVKPTKPHHLRGWPMKIAAALEQTKEISVFKQK